MTMLKSLQHGIVIVHITKGTMKVLRGGRMEQGAFQREQGSTLNISYAFLNTVVLCKLFDMFYYILCINLKTTSKE